MILLSNIILTNNICRIFTMYWTAILILYYLILIISLGGSYNYHPQVYRWEIWGIERLGNWSELIEFRNWGVKMQIQKKKKQTQEVWFYSSSSKKISLFRHLGNFSQDEAPGWEAYTLVLLFFSFLPGCSLEDCVRWNWKYPLEVCGNPLWYSCLENPMDRGVCQAIVHRVAKS